MDIQPCQGQTTVIKNLRDGTKLSHVYLYLLMIHDHDVHSQIFRQLLNPWKKKTSDPKYRGCGMGFIEPPKIKYF